MNERVNTKGERLNRCVNAKKMNGRHERNACVRSRVPETHEINGSSGMGEMDEMEGMGDMNEMGDMDEMNETDYVNESTRTAEMNNTGGVRHPIKSTG